MYNPGGPALPAPQESLQQDYRTRLMNDHGIGFSRLLTITNMAVNRFADTLRRRGQLEDYMGLLSNHFSLS